MKLVSNILIDSACCIKPFSMDKEDILDLFYVLLVLNLLKMNKVSTICSIVGKSKCLWWEQLYLAIA